MNESELFNTLVTSWFVLAAVVCLMLFFFAAPYGRHIRKGWGPTVENRLGWVVMEAPAALVFALCFLLGEETGTVTALILFGLWEVHYVHRAFIYPLGLRGMDKRMPVAVAGMAFLFNTVNGYLNGRYIFALSGGYPAGWLGDLRFVAGLGLFLVGFVINHQADSTLRTLRRDGESGYEVPHGGLYRWISCPNYFGEIVEWVGWAVATWALPCLAFAVWTAANLVPRAWANHRWYREHFPDYPAERKALLPGLW
jgi:3-oxo-5-alpha-steroid 4-dehydrogenase 1